jgi:N-acetylmuramoyl-L-alanine amidase
VSGRRDDALRLRLDADDHAWVPLAEARLLPPPRPAPRAVLGAVSVQPRADRLVLRAPLGQRVPFHVVETGPARLEVRVFGASSDADWIRYGAADPLLRSVAWTQASADELALTIDLAEPIWGWRARWSGTDLVLELRRPPAIDPSDPLRGRLVFVDPGHPPLGATGPTGLREADANLGVAVELARMLEEAGARVAMARTTDSAVELLPRTQRAERIGAELLISVHNNALPDGVNPFTNNGTSVFYNHPHAVDLAREVQAALVRRLGLRDLGIARGDLALVRPTWMPAVLTEGLFMMIPEQEAALRTPEGRRLYAQGIFDGVRRFLAERGREAAR